MPRDKAPSEQEIRNELKKQGIENFDQLLTMARTQAEKKIKDTGGVVPEWYIAAASSWVLVGRE